MVKCEYYTCSEGSTQLMQELHHVTQFLFEDNPCNFLIDSIIKNIKKLHFPAKKLHFYIVRATKIYVCVLYITEHLINFVFNHSEFPPVSFKIYF